MPPSLDFDRDVLPVVDELANAWFRKRPECRADCISLAWEFFQRAPPAATPRTLAWYAIRWVRLGRQFPEKERSIMGPNPRRLPKPQRDALVDVLVRRNADPAVIAQMRIDFGDWLVALTARQREFLELFLAGERSKDIAKRLNVSPARVSQIRGELVAHWQAFTG